MRRLTLLLGLLMTAALSWLAGSADAPAIPQENQAVLRATPLNAEAVNSGFHAPWDAVGIAAADAAWITPEMSLKAIHACPYSGDVILLEWNQRRESGFIAIKAGRMIEKSGSNLRPSLIHPEKR